MQRFYGWPAPPGRKLLETIAGLNEGDTLSIPGLAVFGNEEMRRVVLNTLLQRGISLKVREVEPELVAELAEWRNRFRDAAISRAHERGSYDHGGRPRTIDRGPIKRLLAKGMSPIDVARKLNIPPSTVYRVRDEIRSDELRAAAAD
jgi:hypothetical protein